NTSFTLAPTLRSVLIVRGLRQALQPSQFPFQMSPYRGPFGGNDAVDAGIAQRAVGRALVIAQNAVQLGTETFDGSAAGVVEEVGAELHRKAVQRIEGVAQQKQLGFCVQGCAL